MIVLQERAEVVVIVMSCHHTANMAGAYQLPHCTGGESFKHQAVPAIYIQSHKVYNSPRILTFRPPLISGLKLVFQRTEGSKNPRNTPFLSSLKDMVKYSYDRF